MEMPTWRVVQGFHGIHTLYGFRDLKDITGERDDKQQKKAVDEGLRTKAKSRTRMVDQACFFKPRMFP